MTLESSAKVRKFLLTNGVVFTFLSFLLIIK